MPDVQHSNLTGSAAVHPSSYVATSDPGAVGANKEWTDTSGATPVRKIRNAANTAWLSVINPMTTAGDMVRGGTSGNPTRVPIGAEGQALVVSGGVPAWGSSSGASIYLARTLY